MPVWNGRIGERLETAECQRVPSGSGALPRSVCSYALVAGLTPGLSLKNFLFSSMKFFH